VRYEYSTKNRKQQLFTYNINQIISASLISNEQLRYENTLDRSTNQQESKENLSNERNFDVIPIRFQAVKSIEDGFIDAIEAEENQNLTDKSIIEVELDYDEDLNFPKKKRIYRILNYSIAALLLGNLIISMVKFGNSLFWL
jgi:hypothetical protein